MLYDSFYTISTQLKDNLQIPNLNFSEKSAFESGLLILRESVFFSNLSFSLVWPNPYTRMCVSTMGTFELFRKRMNMYGKHLSNLSFFSFR